MSPQDITDGTTAPHSVVRTTGPREERTRPETRSPGRSVDWSDTIEDQPTEEAVLQISGVGHWFLEGWIPGGLGVCGDGVVMQLLSGSNESWGTGGCVATHGQEVVRRQWLTYRYPGMFVLCGVVPGAPGGVPHSGV